MALTIQQRLTRSRSPDHARGRHRNYNASAWRAFDRSPVGTGHDHARLNQALLEVVKSPRRRSRFDELGLRPLTSTPDELGAFHGERAGTWGKVVEAAGAKGIE